ncbi:MAG: hypothetical protein HEQ23_14365 [Tepidisphaera sp.]
MAKKTSTAKPKSKAASKGAPKVSKPAAKPAKKPAPKPIAKKPDAKSAPAKKAEAKKPDVKKPEAKKPEAKKPDVKKVDVKKPAPAAKPEAKKAEIKKPEAKKPEAKKPEAKKPEVKPAAKPVVKPGTKAEAETPAAPPADDKAASARKGITIVPSKPLKKPKPKAPSTDISALAGSLLSSGFARKPLIASGPNAPALKPLGVQGVEEVQAKVAGKSPFGKKELEHFRAILLRKRAELLGDVSHLEEEALRGESGALSNMPQHMAEQGSETYEQSLHLDLAAAGSKLIKEIDDAIRRIDAGTFGICELTGKPIRVERLEELPWARHSIEAARELERRSMRT